MVLLLVTHVVEVPSSRVPLAVIILNDAIKRKSLPPNLKCRMVIPSCGNYSSSMWDASSIEELQQWIDANLMDGVAHIAEIPEEFTYGLALELTTARAADKVATSSKNTIEKINTTSARVMETVAEKLHRHHLSSTAQPPDPLDRLDQRTNLITATREATTAAVDKVKQATDRALESEGVQKSLATISSSLQTAGTRMGKAFSWVGSKVKESLPAGVAAPGAAGGAASGGSYSAFGAEGAAPPSYNAAYSAPPYMPVSTNPARQSVEAEAHEGGAGTAWGAVMGTPVEDPAPMPHFTLHDDGYGSPHFAGPQNDAAPAHSGTGAGLSVGGEQSGVESAPVATEGVGAGARTPSAGH